MLLIFLTWIYFTFYEENETLEVGNVTLQNDSDSKLGKTIMEPSKYILLIPQFQAIYYTLDVENKIRISSVKMNGQDL